MLPIKRTALGSAKPAWRSSTRPARASMVAVAKTQRRDISIEQLDADRNDRERIVILGSGWAGYTLSRNLDHSKYQVIVVSPRSYFVFTPLLASTSVGTLEFRTALEPVRSRSRRSPAQFFQGWANDVDFAGRRLTVKEAVHDPLHGRAAPGGQQDSSVKGKLFDMDWDKLIIAVGCYSQTFGVKGVKENAYFLKDVSDARKIRTRLLSCFETAALPSTSTAMRRQLLNFAVVGGGPTGIEWSAELRDLINEDMKRLYPHLVPYAKITVYDVAPRVLSMFDTRLSEYAMDMFKRDGISIKTQHHIEELRKGTPGAAEDAEDSPDTNPGYTLKLRDKGEVGVGMCVWSTGLMMNPFVAKALTGKVRQHAKSGSIMTNDRLQAFSADGAALTNVYGLGDCAILEGTSYPATAQVASQKALWLAKRINKGDIEQHGFTYKDLGIMAYIGNWNAILQSQKGEVSGRFAWFIWRGAYLAKSISWRNRMLIPMYWVISWMFGRDVSRF